MKRLLQFIVFTLGILCISAPAFAERSYDGVFALNGTQSFTTQVLDKTERNGGFGVGFRGGFRRDWWGMFMEIQYVSWSGYAALSRNYQSSFNAGIGAEWLYFDHRLRTAVSFGTAILAKEAPPDPVGTMGIYLDVVPAGYVFRPASNLNIVITPITLFVNVPSLKGIPLLVIQYRTVVSIEFSL